MYNVSFKSLSGITNPELVKHLFAGIGENFIFEIELGEPVPKVDFSTCILKNQIPGLLKHWQNREMKKIFKSSANWQKIFRFCAEWGEAGSLPDINIQNIWFEFDHDQLVKELPEPCLFFSIRGLDKKSRFEKDKSNKSKLNWLFESSFQTLVSKKLTGNLAGKVEECMSALPPNGAVFQIGVLLSRNPDSLRLCTAMPVNEYRGYLEKIKWPGSFEYIIPSLHTFGSCADAVFLDIDVGEEVLPKIGMECAFRKKSDIKAKLAEFLGLLIELQLCSKKNASIVVDWLNNEDRKETFGKKAGLKRDLSHIKIILDEDNMAVAKAYLSLSNWQQ